MRKVTFIKVPSLRGTRKAHIGATLNLQFSSANAFSIVENNTAVGTVTSAEGATYEIIAGLDGALFSIDVNTGVLAFLSAPDFENPIDVPASALLDEEGYPILDETGGFILDEDGVISDNIYQVNVKATLGSRTGTQLIAITVLNDINDLAQVVIGSQTWALKNLDIITTIMGNVIPFVSDATAWEALTTPGCCYPDGLEANAAIYGVQYNAYALTLIQTDIDAYNAAHPTAPFTWAIPTNAQLTTLQTGQGGATVAGGKLKEAGLDHWNTPNTGADNASGLTLLGAGSRGANGTYSATKGSGSIKSIDGFRIYALPSNDDSVIQDIASLPKYGFTTRLIKTV